MENRTHWTGTPAQLPFVLAGIALACRGEVLDIPTSYGRGADAGVATSAVSGYSEFANYGGAASLVFAHSSYRASYLRFDLSQVRGRRILDAGLFATVTTEVAGNPTEYVFGLNDGLQDGTDLNGWGKYGEGWPEDKLCWTNAPALSSNNTSFAIGPNVGEVTRLAIRRNGSGSTITPLAILDETILLAAGPNLVGFLNADTDGQATFIVVPGISGSSNRIYLKSKEHADGQPPLLRVVTEDSVVRTLRVADGAGADAHITELTETNTTYGASTSLRIGKVSSVNYNGKALVRFDLSGMVRPFRHARLDVTVNGGKNGMAVEWYGLNDASAAGSGYLGEDWSEGALCWSNAPGGNTISNAVSVGTGTSNGGQLRKLLVHNVNRGSGLGTGESTDLDYVTVGSTFTAIQNDALLEFLNDDGNDLVTFVCRAANDGLGGGQTSLLLASKEDATYPSARLVLVDSRPVGTLLSIR